MFIPFLAALSSGAQTVFDKVSLSKHHIPIRTYIPYLFLYLFFFSALSAPFLGYINWQMLLTPPFLFLFLILVVLAITWNIFYYESLQREDLSEFETVIMMTPLVTVALSWVFFPETWDMRVGLAALAGAAALIWAHWDRHHFTFNHYSMNLLVAIVLMATEDIVITEFLRDQVFSPVGLYVVRTLILFGFFAAYYRIQTKKVSRKHLNSISIAGFLGFLFMVLKFYGYETLGIPYTSLVMLAGPMTVYLGSAFVMHERMRSRTVIAAAIIASAIVYATSILVK